MKTYLFLLPFLLCFACSNSVTEDATQVETTTEIPADFQDFYQQFHTDSVFQMAHIQFPLQSPTGEGTTIRIDADQWTIQRGIQPASGYTSHFTALTDDLIIEEIINPKDKTGLVRRFLRDGDSWKLIYYQGISNLKD